MARYAETSRARSTTRVFLRRVSWEPNQSVVSASIREKITLRKRRRRSRTIRRSTKVRFIDKFGGGLVLVEGITMRSLYAFSRSASIIWRQVCRVEYIGRRGVDVCKVADYRHPYRALLSSAFDSWTACLGPCLRIHLQDRTDPRNFRSV